MKAANGTVVTMHYTLTDDSGTELDSSRESEPMAYLHGQNNIIAGLEKALEGATAGHRAKVTVAHQDGYGPRDPDAVFTVPRSSFPEDMTLEPGEEVHAQTPDGPMSFVVVEVGPETAVLDANHPLAGKTLHFDVEVISVREATAEELSHGHVHGPGGHH